jgi:phosphatidylglycerol---prolipoprotein diacylglyceryl transferase
VFPVAWVFGRMGCAVVHDHPGLRAGAWMPLAVAYGPGPVESYGFFELRHGNVARYDLGLLEMLFAVLVSIAFAATWKKRLPVGWYVAVLPIVYAPVRFALDFLRLDDPAGGDLRYGRLTPAQWACIALLLGGLFLYSRVTPPAPAVRAIEPVA